MKTSFGKLSMLAIVLAIGILLLAPMRSGEEDRLRPAQSRIQLDPGEVCAVEYELETDREKVVEFSSDNPAIAYVDQRGYVMGISPGETKIRLKAKGGAIAKVDVEVTGTPVTYFKLNVDALDLDKGEVSGLSYELNRGASVPQVQWQSLDPEVVQVDAAGRISAVGGGETYVVATVPGGLTDSALVRVNVDGVSVQVTPADLCVGMGTDFLLEAQYMPADTTDDVISWTSSDPNVLTVDGNGRMEARSVGTAQVTVTTRKGLVGTADVTVEPATQGLQVSPRTVTVERGSMVDLDANFIGADGEPDHPVNHYMEWESSEPRIASVKDGKVTGHSSGVVMIKAKSDGFESSCKVHVKTSVQEVHLNITEQYLLREQVGEPFQLRGSVLPADADDQKLEFSSDNELVATVSPDGLVSMTGGYGTAIITATAESGAQATCTVSVVTQLPNE